MAKSCGKILFFPRFGALPSTATQPTLGQNSIFFSLKPCAFNEDSPQLSIWRIGQLWKELGPFEWTWSFFGSKFACRRLADRHAAARISDGSWTFLKIPSLGGPREQCPVGKPVFRHFGSLGAFLLAENRGKFQLFHVSRHFRALPRTQISIKIQLFLTQIDGHSIWIHHNFQWGRLANCGRS